MKKISYVLLLAVFMLLWYTNAEEFSQEMREAYQYSYERNITTINDINKADMNWWLTRIAMAKMLSNYAINSLGRKPDTSRVPNFKDVSSKLDADYNNWVTLAYQLGIMWVWIDKFRPFDLVTRAEFGTAFSRVLFWNIYNQDWGAYYVRHLQALKSVWIMNQIDKPQQWEIRWFVMIMLLRSDKKWFGHWNWNSNWKDNNNNLNNNPNITPNQNSNKTWDNKPTTWNNQTSTNTSSSWWWGGWWWGGWWGGWWWGGWWWGGWWWGGWWGGWWWGGWWWGGWWWGGWWWGGSSSTTEKYTVNWLNRDGATLETDENVPAGTIPTYDWTIPFRSSTSPKSFIFSWWKPEIVPVVSNTTYKAEFTTLEQDGQKRFNVLIIWYWWENWEWYHLIPDSMIVASWNMNTHEVTLISLPFQEYIKKYYGYYWYDVYSNVFKHTTKKLAEDMKSWASDILWLDVQKYVTMDFTTFTKAIDILWWIDIYVDDNINDSQYPNDLSFVNGEAEFSRDTVRWYAPYSISKWTHHLNWEQTLKYIRSINTTSASNRSYRQQKVLQAIKNQISEWFNISQIWNFYTQVYFWKIENDFNFSDASWIVRNLKNIQKFSSYEYSTKIPYLKFDWLLNSENQNITLTTYSVTWTTAFWKNFSTTNTTRNSFNFELFVWEDSYIGNMGCEMNNDGNIQCRTSTFNLPNIQVNAEEDINISLIIPTSPLIRYNVDDVYYVTLNWKYPDWSTKDFVVPVTISNSTSPLWFEISNENSCNPYEDYGCSGYCNRRHLTKIKLTSNTQLITKMPSILFNIYDDEWNKVTDNKSIYEMETDQIRSKLFGAISYISNQTSYWTIIATSKWYLMTFNNTTVWESRDIDLTYEWTGDFTSKYHVVIEEVNWLSVNNTNSFDTCRTSNMSVCKDPEVVSECEIHSDKCPWICDLHVGNVWYALVDLSSDRSETWADYTIMDGELRFSRAEFIKLKTDADYQWKIYFDIKYKPNSDSDWINIDNSNMDTYFASWYSNDRSNWYTEMLSTNKWRKSLNNLFKRPTINWIYHIKFIDENWKEFSSMYNVTIDDNNWSSSGWNWDNEKSWNLSISAVSAEVKNVIKWWTSDMDTLTFKPSEEIKVNKITLEKYGYSTNDAVAEIRLENGDWNIITSAWALDSYWRITLTVKKDYKVISNSEDWTIVVRLSEDANNWWTVWFRVIDVDSSAENFNLDGYTSYVYNIISYESNNLTLTNNLESTHYTYNWDETFKIASIKLKAPDTTTATIKWFTFTNNWNLNSNLLENLSLIADNRAINMNYEIKNKEISISFNDIDLSAKSSISFDLYSDLSELSEYWKYLKLSISESTDIRAIDKKTGARMVVSMDDIIRPEIYFDNPWWDNPWSDNPWWDNPWSDNPWWDNPWSDNPWSDKDPEDTENCAYIKVDNWNSYCFNITKVSGSNFTMSINGDTEGVYWCSVTRVSDSNSSWVSNSCWIYSFTVLPSNWVTEFFLRLSYDSKQYTKRVSYDLTNWIFIWD